jgi:phosphoribosylanthranilate isomerase
MRVKICGITSVEDAALAVESGADAIGLVFYEPSPRYVRIQQAVDIAYSAGPFITVVGLFVNSDKAAIDNIIKHVPLNLLQFHGDELPTFCEQFSLPYMRAIRMRDDLDLDKEIKRYKPASAILLDAYKPGVPGGTGETFDWERVPRQSSQPIVLAGGLTPDNVCEAIKQARPYGVDISGGVESSPGIKDKDKVVAFINNAKVAI